ncbi:MAG TPA: YdcF family protein [Candidatus Acidoferrum sp.]|nr:YdcF family protein [Candidatus Acidoferrum sp.]
MSHRKSNPLQSEAGSHARRNHRVRAILFGLAGTVLLSCVAVFLLVGRWLVVEDPLEKAQAIAVLSGAMPSRAKEAARLYREGYASEVWLTHSAEPGAELASMGIPFAGEDYYNVQVLQHSGVPAAAIQVLAPPIENTADEIRAISDRLGQEKLAAVIIVTSKVHTRRTRILWRQLAESKGRLIVRAASDDSFHPKRWWSSTRDALDVVREVLGVLNAWAGLPLKPAR